MATKKPLTQNAMQQEMHEERIKMMKSISRAANTYANTLEKVTALAEQLMVKFVINKK